jgi:hypothetical protein
MSRQQDLRARESYLSPGGIDNPLNLWKRIVAPAAQNPVAGSALPDLNEFRYEVKFVCTGEFRNMFEVWRRLVPENLTRSYDNRVVNNIYFDSFGLKDLHDNVIGLSDRLKTRLRWYGKTGAPEKMVLEQKIKRGRSNCKKAWNLDGIDLAETNWRELADYLVAQAEHRTTVLADNFGFPTLRNTYLREYFTSRGGHLRMTIDRDLTFFDPVTSATLLGGLGRRMSVSIVEFKAPVELADELDHLLRKVPLRASRFSKYVTGLSTLRG